MFGAINNAKLTAKNLVPTLPLLFLLAVRVLWAPTPSFGNVVAICVIGAVGLIVGVLLVRTGKGSARSIGSIFLAAIAMQLATSVPLIVGILLSFAWLIDDLRDGIVHYSLFSGGMLLLMVGAISYIERPVDTTSEDGVLPVTPGLVLSLSKLGPTPRRAAEVEASLLELVDKASRGATKQEVAEAFDMAVSAKTEIAGRYKMGEVADIEHELMARLETLDVPEAVRALLVELVGKYCPLYPMLAAINHHVSKVKYIWILETDEAKAQSRASFEALAGFLFGERLRKANIMYKSVKDAHSVTEARDAIEEIYGYASTQGLSGADVTSDITGGTAAISAGIILACVRSNRKVEYMRQDTFVLQPIQVTVDDVWQAVEEFLDQTKAHATR